MANESSSFKLSTDTLIQGLSLELVVNFDEHEVQRELLLSDSLRLVITTGIADKSHPRYIVFKMSTSDDLTTYQQVGISQMAKASLDFLSGMYSHLSLIVNATFCDGKLTIDLSRKQIASSNTAPPSNDCSVSPDHEMETETIPPDDLEWIDFTHRQHQGAAITLSVELITRLIIIQLTLSRALSLSLEESFDNTSPHQRITSSNVLSRWQSLYANRALLRTRYYDLKRSPLELSPDLLILQFGIIYLKIHSIEESMTITNLSQHHCLLQDHCLFKQISTSTSLSATAEPSFPLSLIYNSFKMIEDPSLCDAKVEQSFKSLVQLTLTYHERFTLIELLQTKFEEMMTSSSTFSLLKRFNKFNDIPNAQQFISNMNRKL